tara:strand:+ start:35 stop:382 length:348 start_codon:yes stop_codon:yes gene_type:complete
MKIIFSIFLTLALVSCGEIRLQIGGDDVGEVGKVGEWVWQPVEDNNTIDAYLVNSRTGEVRQCPRRLGNDFYRCYVVTHPALSVRQMTALNIDLFNLYDGITTEDNYAEQLLEQF